MVADAVAVPGLCRSWPRLPRCGSCTATTAALRAVGRAQRVLGAWPLAGAASGASTPAPAPAFSAGACAAKNLLTCSVHCSCGCRQSTTVPRHALAALDERLTPSPETWVPPQRCGSAPRRSISPTRDLISSFIDATKAAIVLWSGSLPPASAIKVLLSRQACAICRDDSIPRA